MRIGITLGLVFFHFIGKFKHILKIGNVLRKIICGLHHPYSARFSNVWKNISFFFNFILLTPFLDKLPRTL